MLDVRINGQAVRAAREAITTTDGRTLSRERLAAQIGVSSATIERVETNKGDVAAGTAFLLAQALEVDLDSLFTENGEAVA